MWSPQRMENITPLKCLTVTITSGDVVPKSENFPHSGKFQRASLTVHPPITKNCIYWWSQTK